MCSVMQTVKSKSQVQFLSNYILESIILQIYIVPVVQFKVQLVSSWRSEQVTGHGSILPAQQSDSFTKIIPPVQPVTTNSMINHSSISQCVFFYESDEVSVTHLCVCQYRDRRRYSRVFVCSFPHTLSHRFWEEGSSRFCSARSDLHHMGRHNLTTRTTRTTDRPLRENFTK